MSADRPPGSPQRAPRLGGGGGDRGVRRATVSRRHGRSRLRACHGPAALRERGAQPAETPAPGSGAAGESSAAFVPRSGGDGPARAGRAAGGCANARRPQPTTNDGPVRSARAADLSLGGRADLGLIPLVVGCGRRSRPGFGASVDAPGRGLGACHPSRRDHSTESDPRLGRCNNGEPAEADKPLVLGGSLMPPRVGRFRTAAGVSKLCCTAVRGRLRRSRGFRLRKGESTRE